MADKQIIDLPLEIDPKDDDLLAIQQPASPNTTRKVATADVVRQNSPGENFEVLYVEGAGDTKSMRGATNMKWVRLTAGSGTSGRLAVNVANPFTALHIAEDESPARPDTLILLQGTADRDKVNIEMVSEQSGGSENGTILLEGYGESRFNFYQGGFKIIGNLNSANITAGNYELLRLNAATGYLSLGGTPLAGGGVQSASAPTIGQAEAPLHIFFAQDSENPNVAIFEDTEATGSAFIKGGILYRSKGQDIARSYVWDEATNPNYEGEFVWENTLSGATGVLTERLRIRDNGTIAIGGRLPNQSATNYILTAHQETGDNVGLFTTDTNAANIQLNAYYGESNVGGDAYLVGKIEAENLAGTPPGTPTDPDSAFAIITRQGSFSYRGLVVRGLKTLINGAGSLGVRRDPSVSLEINANDAIQFPVGNTAQRPTTPGVGMLRWSNEPGIDTFEAYNGTDWVAIGEGGGGINEDRYMFASNLDNVQVGYYFDTLSFDQQNFDSTIISSIGYESSTDGITYTSHGSSLAALNIAILGYAGLSWYLRVTATYVAGQTITSGLQLKYSR